ncbi:MAG: NAD(P)-binding domain-containing protein [Candidatus Sulfotelmatobacter sp.]|jgi:thioredoxin reductase
MFETVIIGAGPYGLSIAAHLRGRGIPFRIFGRIMDSWRAHMPKGMCLKSDGFASNIYDPNGDFTLAQFCAERGIEYADTGIPVKLDTFCAYGQEFRDRKVPELEDKQVTSLERVSGGFRVGLDTGETFTARHVVLAVGITHFEHLPAEVANLPAEFVTHSFRHHDLEPFRGRNVVVLGAGSSASDMAGLLHEAGADVQLVTRRSELKFHGKPDAKRRSLLDKLRRPHSGIGPGWRLRFFANAPGVFHYLPESLRLEAVRRVLGPSGGWFAKDKVVGKVPMITGHTLQRAEVQNGRVKLHLRGADGSEQQILTEHVIAATGYRVNLNRLKFLSPEICSTVKVVNGSPVLSTGFESSMPGLYFAGVSAANSFGPVMRFAYGAGFAARTIAHAVAKSVANKPALAANRHQLREIDLPEAREKAGAASQGS